MRAMSSTRRNALGTHSGLGTPELSSRPLAEGSRVARGGGAGHSPTSTPRRRGDLTVCALVPGVQEKLGVMNKGVVYALWGYEAQNSDELTFHEGDAITILRRKDESETEWWWARLGDREGYVPKNLLGVSPLSAPQDPLSRASLAPEAQYQPAVREHWAQCEDRPC